MYGGPIGIHQRSFGWYRPRPFMASPCSRLGVCNVATPLISGTGKATDFKFGGYIYRANPNKSPLKFLEKRERGRIQGLPNFFGYPPGPDLAGGGQGPNHRRRRRERGGGIAVDHISFRFWISGVIPEILEIKVESCQKSR